MDPHGKISHTALICLFIMNESKNNQETHFKEKLITGMFHWGGPSVPKGCHEVSTMCC